MIVSTAFILISDNYIFPNPFKVNYLELNKLVQASNFKTFFVIFTIIHNRLVCSNLINNIAEENLIVKLLNLLFVRSNLIFDLFMRTSLIFF